MSTPSPNKARFVSATVKLLTNRHINNLGEPSIIDIKNMAREHFRRMRQK